MRSEVAAAAGVSTGNVTKVSQLRKTAHPTVKQSVSAGEISIHRAWQWIRLSPQQQLHDLEKYRSRKGTNQTSRRLIKKHVARLSPTQLIPPSLGDFLCPFVPHRSGLLDSIAVTEVDAPGNVAYLTNAVFHTPEINRGVKMSELNRLKQILETTRGHILGSPWHSPGGPREFRRGARLRDAKARLELVCLRN